MRLWHLFLGWCMLLVWAPFPAEAAMPPSNLHRIIAHQTGWLNTSRPLTAEDLQGRILLLDFWTYCCINCMHVIPDLKYLEDRFGDKLTVIGVHSAKFQNERDSGNIRQAILRYGIHHPVVNDFDFSVWQAFGIRAWPTFVLINPKGIIAATYFGEGHREELAHDIEKLIQRSDGTINAQPLPIALEQDKQPPSVLAFPSKLAYGRFGTNMPALYISDSGHNRIVVLSPEGRLLAAIGSGAEGLKDGDFVTAQFRHPQGIALDFPLLYVADTENHTLRRIDLVKQTVETIAGTGKQGHDYAPQHAPARQMALSSPWDVAFYPDNKHLAIAMAGTHQLWSYDIAAQTLSVLAGNGHESIEDGTYPHNALAQTSGLSAVGDKLYFVDAETSSLRLLEKGMVKTLIGTGLFDFGYKEGKQGVARLQHPLGLAADASQIFVADSYNHSIRRYDPATGILSNVIGHGQRGDKDGAFAEAEFNEPNDVLEMGNKLYIADTNNNAIRIADLDMKQVTTLAVSEPQTTAPTFSESLPNAEKSAPVALAPATPVTVHIALQPGWHVNESAPSSLALFDMTTAPTIVASFGIDALKARQVMLPALNDNTSYRLQATLYYCEDRAGSQCLIKSFDMPLAIKPGGKKEVTLKRD